MQLRAHLPTFLTALFLVLVSACGGGSEALQAARADLRAGQLEAAERKLLGVEGAEVVELREQIAAVRAEREAVARKIETILAAVDTSTQNQLRERLKLLRDKTKDPVARERVAKTLSDLQELLLQHGGAGRALAQDGPGARGDEPKDARDDLIARLRADIREALRDQQWRRAEELTLMLATQPSERVAGELAPLRAELVEGARKEAARLAAQARDLQSEQGAAVAREWLAAHCERFPTGREFAELFDTLRELESAVARTEREATEEQVAKGRTEPEPELIDPVGATTAELLLAPPVPEGLSVETLVVMARESAAKDELAFARQCWLAASRKLFPGDLRDDYIGEAQDLRARLALRAELIEAFRTQRAAFTNLGIESVTAQGWSEGGELRAWGAEHLDTYKRVAAAVELSQLARRGVLCELLRAADTAERDRAISDLARMVERGEIAAADAGNMVARARGGLGAAERWLLEKGRWVTQASADAEHSAESDLQLAKAFLRADGEAREAAFDALVAGGSEAAVRKALRDRSIEALRALEKSKAADGLRSLAELRRDLDEARKAALALIFDENVYFYPYNPPEPPRTAGDYARAQQRVDELVAAVRAAAERSKTVKLTKDFRAAGAEVEWCRAAHRELGWEFALPESAPEYLLAQHPALLEVELLSFAWTSKEAEDLAYDRAVVAYNERAFAGYAKRKDADPFELPNVAEQEQVRITNRYRMLMGRRAVAWNPRIQVAAQGHSEYMANTGDFGHFEKGDPARRSPFDRMKLAGYPRGVSENCAMVGGDPQAAHDGWLHSSGHHRNILMSGHREMASASASNYWTQNFGADTAFQKDLEQ